MIKNNYSRNFMRILREAQVDPEREAMEATLDDGTDPTDFDVSMDLDGDGDIGRDEVADAMSRQNQQMVAKIQDWIGKTNEFLQFLNGEDSNSIQSQLAAAVPETIMDKMKQSQQTKISRVASDLASFHQSLLGFAAQTKNSRFRGV